MTEYLSVLGEPAALEAALGTLLKWRVEILDAMARQCATEKMYAAVVDAIRRVHSGEEE